MGWKGSEKEKTNYIRTGTENGTVLLNDETGSNEFKKKVVVVNRGHIPYFLMLTFNDKNMTYDNNGNMTSVTNTCGTTTYTWDVRNRLVGISGFKPDCSPLSASFRYDALGRRIEKTINGTNTKYLYDGLDIVQEIQGTAKTNYIRTMNIDRKT